MKQIKRVLLKLSGESLKGSEEHGIDGEKCKQLAHAIRDWRNTGLEIGVVIGGGNIFRGIRSESLNFPRPPADYMGMMATMINGIALQQTLITEGCPAHVMSGLECPKAVESYNWYNAMQYLDKGQVVIFVGGTGNPYFTTDTAAALRASEIHANILLKATKVDGVYDKDPIQFPDAKRYATLSFSETLAQKLEVMDATSIALCQKSDIPVLVFDMKLLLSEQTNVASLEQLGTLIE